MRLYPKLAPVRQSFKGVKKTVVPMQSMSLKEIIKRFIRKESLPLSQEGVYEDRYDYDLEKLAHEDLTVKEEILKEAREKTKALDKKVKKEKADKDDAMAKAAAAKKKELFEELRKEYATPPPNPQGT